jgi:carboxyl-terminal processing protease
MTFCLELMKKITLIAALIWLFSTNSIFAQIIPENRVKTFDQVWRIINEKYYDENFGGVDWTKVKTDYRPKIDAAKNDDEFYEVIKEMVRELHDAHTRFWTPKEAELRKNKQFSGVGLKIDEIEGKFFVTSVKPNSEEEKLGVKAGMSVTKINGQDFAESVAKAAEAIKSSTPQAVKILSLRSLLRGEVGSTLNLSLIDNEGKTLDVSLTRRIFDKSLVVTATRLDNNIGYLKFDTFDSKLMKDLRNALETLKDTKGLIIDLRDNGGGDINVVTALGSLLFNEKTSFGKTKWRSKDSKELVIKSEKGSAYINPIVVLIDKDSASGSELLAQGLQDINRAKIIGSTSCGCLLGIAGAKELKAGELEFSQIGFVSAKGKIVEGNGVSPDLMINVEIKDLQNHYDRTLAEAVKYLTQENSK